eukprot:798880_1
MQISNHNSECSWTNKNSISKWANKIISHQHPFNTTIPHPRPQTCYIRPAVVYGHVHIGKTAGTSLNGNLSLQFERICGHKGYSYDAFQFQQRSKSEANWMHSKDLISEVYDGGFNRGRVPEQIMDEIGYEDCDWISHEVEWPFCTRSNWIQNRTPCP